MDIKGTTRVCGLIGNPVEHSISPVIHNNLARMCEIDMLYTTFKVEKNDIRAAITGAYALNILGMNVTVPHKQAVIESLVNIDPLAASIGAVNTLVRVDGGYKGYNTDILGLKRSLEDENFPIKDENIIILGAGGASRAIAFLCATEEAKKVYLLNRTLDKAVGIAYAVNEHMGKEVIFPMEIKDYGSLPRDVKYMCIQTTSVGLHPHDEDVVIDDSSFYQLIHTGVDVIYNPYETAFMKMCRKSGAKTCNGMKMLLYQGIAAFELWNNVKVDETKAKLLYELMKKGMHINE